MYHINRFANIEPSLHPGNKSHFTMVYNPFNVLLDFGLQVFCSGLLHQCSPGILACSFLFIYPGFGVTVMLASLNKFWSISSSSVTWNSLRRIGILLLNVW